MRSTFPLRALAAAIAAIACQPGFANPTGPSVASGSATFATSGSTLNVTNSPNAIINWQGFSIGSGELTKFNQQSAASAVLNRVTSQNPSSILGTLQSNGRVFLINPNGITSGAGSVIDVAGLVASSLNLSDADFLSGRLRFAGGGAGPVINNGSITTEGTGAPAYLVGPAVTNGGVITSPQGEVMLAAGETVEVIDPGTPDVQVRITASSEQALNLGSVMAQGGRINIFAGVVNQYGLVSANSAVAGPDGSVIFIRASSGGQQTATSGDVAFGPESTTESKGTIFVFADSNIWLQSTSPGHGAIIQTPGQVFMDAGVFREGKTISQGPDAAILDAALRASVDSQVGLNGPILLPGPNRLREFRAITGGVAASGGSNVVLNNTSPVLTTSFQMGNFNAYPNLLGGTFTLHQDGDLVIGGAGLYGGSTPDSAAGSFNITATGNVSTSLNGHMRVDTTGSQNLSAGGNLTLKAGSGDGWYAAFRAGGPIQFSADGNITVQGGSGRYAYALVQSGSDIALSAGGVISLQQGSGRHAWARVQTERRNSIMLSFPNLSSGGWFVNGVEGAIRRGQSGFFSGHGAAVLGKTLEVTYGAD